MAAILTPSIVSPGCAMLGDLAFQGLPFFLFFSFLYLMPFCCIFLSWVVVILQRRFNALEFFQGLQVCCRLQDCNIVTTMLNKRSKIFVVTFLACSYELPNIELVLNQTLKWGLLDKPLRFQERGQITNRRGMEEQVSFCNTFQFQSS
jgi:hypothetical protein